MKINWNAVIRLKVVVFLGMLIAYWVPAEYAALCGLCTNAIWLWKL